MMSILFMKFAEGDMVNDQRNLVLHLGRSNQGQALGSMVKTEHRSWAMSRCSLARSCQRAMNRTEQNTSQKNRTEHLSIEQDRAEHISTEQNRIDHNTSQQNRTADTRNSSREQITHLSRTEQNTSQQNRTHLNRREQIRTEHISTD